MAPTFTAWTMPPEPASVSRVRHAVVSLLRANGWDERRIDAAALMTSELATNAVQHARTPYTLTVDLTVRTLRVEVRDASASPPTISLTASPVAIGGRGLALVAAYADRWGYEPVAGGKSVWFEVATRR